MLERFCSCCSVVKAWKSCIPGTCWPRDWAFSTFSNVGCLPHNFRHFLATSQACFKHRSDATSGAKVAILVPRQACSTQGGTSGNLWQLVVLHHQLLWCCPSSWFSAYIDTVVHRIDMGLSWQRRPSYATTATTLRILWLPWFRSV
jgi:hypothetical protein